VFYAYLLQSVSFPDHLYHGHTSDLRQRLADQAIVRTRPSSHLAFETLERAQQFEQYLKCGSGHAFARRHLL
jgi:putative endonuclease